MIDLQPKNFLNKREILIFFGLFVVLLIVFFPKNIISNFINKKYADPSIKIKYLETMLQTKDDLNLKIELINAYLKTNQFKKALTLINQLPKNKKNLLLKFQTLEKYYFASKNKKILKQLKNTLTLLASYNDYKFIYKKAIELNMPTLELNALKHLKEEKYFSTLIDMLMWKKKDKELLSLLQKNKTKSYSQKTYVKMLQAALYLKDKNLIKYFLTKVKTNTNPLLVANSYVAIKQYKKGYKIIKKYFPKNTRLLAQFALWSKDFKSALKYYQKLNNNPKIIYQLALSLHRYDILEKMLKQEVKNKHFDKIDELKFVFMQNFHIKEGISFFNQMYKKYKLKKFLLAEFYFYETLGDTQGMKKIAKQLGKEITPYIAMKVANIYLSEKKPQKGYEVLLLASKNGGNKVFYNTLYNFAIITNHKKEAFKLLQKKASTSQDFIQLATYYEENNQINKAFDVLNKHKFNDNYFFFKFINTAYKAKKYNQVINISKNKKDKEILSNPNYWYLYASSYEKLNKIKKAKQIYIQSLKYLGTNPAFYWFLVNHKDTDIKYYIDDIKDDKLLLASFSLLKKYKKALIVVKRLLSKDPNDLDLLVTYYNILENLHKNNTKIRFKIYKLSKKLAKTNEHFFKIYFQFALYYEPYYKMKRHLKYAKKFDDYIDYQILFFTYYGEYNKLKELEKK